MKIKQTLRSLIVGAFLVFGFTASLVPVSPVNAACEAGKPCCGNVQTSILTCTQTGKDGAELKDTGLWGILILTVNILIAGVAVLALGGIIYGIVLYTSAGGNSEQVKKAMGIFTNVVIGIIAFGGMYVLLNFLIPGGAFNNLS